MVLINPDNPSGNYIDLLGVEKLLLWCKHQKIKLVLDESFVDFVDNGKALDELTLISEDVLEKYAEELLVVKSISKSYGIPGARLGVLVSANKDMIAQIKHKVSIWNINSFGEFYMQIAEKYQKDYVSALDKIRHARAEFAEALSRIPWIKVMPSQANYLMCKLNDEVSASELADYLLERNIFVKNLSGKIRDGSQYIRLAVRCEEENEYLARCMREYGIREGN